MIKHENHIVESTGITIANHLAEISRLFKDGAKLTLVVRHPWHPNGERDMVMTEDDLEMAINAIRQRQALEAEDGCGCYEEIGTRLAFTAKRDCPIHGTKVQKQSKRPPRPTE